jgi:hypothetical protein
VLSAAILHVMLSVIMLGVVVLRVMALLGIADSVVAKTRLRSWPVSDLQSNSG